MTLSHRFTWIEGQLDLDHVKQLREILYKWRITTALRRKGGVYTLRIFSPTEKGLKFGKDMFTTLVAFTVAPDHRLEDIFRVSRESIEPPIEHLRKNP